MISGSFTSISGVEYYVTITCKATYNIGVSSELAFGEDPIIIKQDVDESFEHIIKSSATINLVTNKYLGDDLFTSNDRGITVSIARKNKGESVYTTIFFGYVEPFTYSQDFAEEYTNIELTCMDWLSTLENHKYKEEYEYEYIKTKADTLSFRDLLNYVLVGHKIYYDGSVKMSESASNLLDDMGVTELLMCGDEEDDLWTCEELLNEILQYLNLHIVDFAGNMYIFSLETIKNASTINWVNINNTEDTKTTTINTHNVDETYYKADDTNISVGDIFNKWVINCDLQEVEDLMTSPFDEDTISSPFNYKYKYLYDYTVKGNIMAGYSKENEEYWYFQYLTSKNWTFRQYSNPIATMDDYVNHQCIKYTDGKQTYGDQWRILAYFNRSFLCPVFCNLGKVTPQTASDDTKNPSISMTPTIIIPVAGNCDPNYNTTDEYNTAIERFEDAGGMIEYKSTASAGVLSPTDKDVINYIVFSGKFSLQPRSPIENRSEPIILHNGDWGWQFFTDTNWPSSSETYSGKMLKPYMGIEGWRSSYGEEYGDWLFYNAQSGEDKVAKMGVFICELKIGDKYACEYEENKYVWKTKEEAAAAGIETTFSLGFNPAVGDYFLCKEWDISNNLTVDSNVDAEGTAIPITYDDKLNGKVEFRILGLNNLRWGQEIRKHPTFFRSTKWWTTNIDNVMNFVENIYITDFQCKVYSNNGKYTLQSGDQKDLVYMSNVKNKSIHKKEDITFKFNTALTTSEAMEKGVTTSVKLSNVVNLPDKQPVMSIYNKASGNSGKAEEMYINDYYQEYAEPKLIVESSMDNRKTSYWDKFKFSYLSGKTFKVLSTENDLLKDKNLFKLKQL